MYFVGQGIHCVALGSTWGLKSIEARNRHVVYYVYVTISFRGSCNKYTVYNRVFINIILSMLYKIYLIDAFINVFLESFGERKFNVSIMLKEPMYMIFLSAHSEFKALTLGVEPCSSSKL